MSLDSLASYLLCAIMHVATSVQKCLLSKPGEIQQEYLYEVSKV